MLASALTLLAGITIASGSGSASSGPAAAAQAALQPVPVTPAGVAVFVADRETNGLFEVWASKLDGSDPWRLHAPLPPGGVVGNHWVAPDGKHVAYVADQVVPGDFGLFVAPIQGPGQGSGFVRVSPPGEQVLLASNSTPWSPDSQWIAYPALVGNLVNLFAVRPDGSSHARLSDVQFALGGIAEFDWAPDSSRIAYRGDVVVNSQDELYTATPDGLANDRVHPPLQPNMDVDQFFWSPDGSRLAWVADVVAQGVHELYTSFPDGTGFASATAGNALPNPLLSQVEWTLDGQSLVLIGAAATPFVLELWTVRADGSGWTRLSGPLPAGGNVLEFRMAPDGSRVAYRADQLVNDRTELFVSLPDGTGNTPISGPFTSGGAVPLPGGFYWSPNSQHVAYLADQETDGRIEFFVADPTGGGNVKVSGGLYPTASVATPITTPWSPNSKLLTYAAVQFGTHPIAVAPDGTGSVEIAGRLVSGGTASVATWSPAGTRLVYRASQWTAGVFELFASDPDGANNALLSGSMVNGGDVGAWNVH